MHPPRRTGAPGAVVSAKRVVVVAETQRCRAVVLSSVARELGAAASSMVDGLSSTLAGYGVDSAYCDQGSDVLLSDSTGVAVVSLLSHDGATAIELCLVDGSGTYGPVCLEPVLCDIATRACIVCCETADASLGGTSEKASANYLLSAATSVIDTWAATSLNVSRGQPVLLLLAACGTGADSAFGAATSPFATSASASSSARKKSDDYQSEQFDPLASTPVLTSPFSAFPEAATPLAAKAHTTATGVGATVNAVFDYIFRWAKLVLSVLLFGIGQRVVSWRDRVTTVREALQLVDAQCRQSAGPGAPVAGAGGSPAFQSAGFATLSAEGDGASQTGGGGDALARLLSSLR